METKEKAERRTVTQSDRWKHLSIVLDGAARGISDPPLQAANEAFGDIWGQTHNTCWEAIEAVLQGLKDGKIAEDAVPGFIDQAQQALKGLDRAFSMTVCAASEQGYNTGFGDGWHTGAIATLRLFMAAPTPTKALAFLLNLEQSGTRRRDSDEVTAAISAALEEIAAGQKD